MGQAHLCRREQPIIDTAVSGAGGYHAGLSHNVCRAPMSPKKSFVPWLDGIVGVPRGGLLTLSCWADAGLPPTLLSPSGQGVGACSGLCLRERLPLPPRCCHSPRSAGRWLRARSVVTAAPPVL